MVRSSTSRWNSVEQWSPTLFLVGGVLLIGHAALSGIHAFTAVKTPPDVFVTTGHFVALVGLFGLYPALDSRTPKLARSAVSVASLALVSWFVMCVTRFLAIAGVVASLDAVLPSIFYVVVLASTIFTYGLFGAAALRVDTRSRTVGLLVLAPGVLTVVLIVDSALTGVTAFDGLLIASGLAASMLALGDRLRTWNVRRERATPVGGTSTG